MLYIYIYIYSYLHCSVIGPPETVATGTDGSAGQADVTGASTGEAYPRGPHGRPDKTGLYPEL